MAVGERWVVPFDTVQFSSQDSSGDVSVVDDLANRQMLCTQAGLYLMQWSLSGTCSTEYETNMEVCVALNGTVIESSVSQISASLAGSGEMMNSANLDIVQVTAADVVAGVTAGHQGATVNLGIKLTFCDDTESDIDVYKAGLFVQRVG